MNAKPRRRWFQFSLRAFLILLTIAAISLGVYVDRAHRQRDAVKALTARGSIVGYDYPRYSQSSGLLEERSSCRDWLIKHLGQDYAANVQYVHLAVEAKKGGDRSTIADDRLRIVSQFTHLEQLFMNGVDVDDAELVHLQNSKSLKLLSLASTKVGDEGVRYLAKLKNLEYLDLNGTSTRDAGLRHLYSLAKLRHLHLQRTRATEQGVKELREALPSCLVEF